MSASKTKVVEVRLSALTRVEYSQRIEVPADLSEHEENELVNHLYQATDGSEFNSDPDYWERGACYVEPVEGQCNSFKLCYVRTEKGLELNETLSEHAFAKVLAEVRLIGNGGPLITAWSQVAAHPTRGPNDEAWLQLAGVETLATKERAAA